MHASFSWIKANKQRNRATGRGLLYTSVVDHDIIESMISFLVVQNVIQSVNQSITRTYYGVQQPKFGGADIQRNEHS